MAWNWFKSTINVEPGSAEPRFDRRWWNVPLVTSDSWWRDDDTIDSRQPVMTAAAKYSSRVTTRVPQRITPRQTYRPSASSTATQSQPARRLTPTLTMVTVTTSISAHTNPHHSDSHNQQVGSHRPSPQWQCHCVQMNCTAQQGMWAGVSGSLMIAGTQRHLYAIYN